MTDPQKRKARSRRKQKRDNIAEIPDLSHLNASPLKISTPEQHRALKLYLVGCGGNGSWLAPHLVRLARFLGEVRQIKVQLTLIDPDVVEQKNVFRQNFGEAEIGGNKAELLALRYSASWGQSIQVHIAPFAKEMVQLEYRDLGVIVGCVDNAAARRAIAEALDQSGRAYGDEGLPRLWWLDAGNGTDTGQVLLGSARHVRQMQYAFPYFPDPGFCVNLPAPDLQHPELLEAQAEQTSQQISDAKLSCAEMLLTGDQSPSINAMVANIAATYLWRLFTDAKGLTTFATYCNLNALSVRSRYITPDHLAQVMHKTTKMFKSKMIQPRGSSQG